MKFNQLIIKSIFTSILLVACSKLTYSQAALLIKSADDNSELPFATISNISKQIIYSGDKTGLAKINTAIGDTLLISYIGYISQSVIIKNTDFSDTIFLKRSSKTLKEVIIQKCKRYKTYSISNIDKSSDHFFGVECTKGNYNGKVAVKLQNGGNEAKLKSISFWLKKMLSSTPEYAVESPFLISFYSVSDLNLPGELLYMNPLIYFPQKLGKQELNVDSINIHIPIEGLFVCFEFIMDERYQWESKLNDSAVIHQGVIIDGGHTTNADYWFYNYEKDSWDRLWKENPQSINRSTIRVEATVKSCKE